MIQLSTSSGEYDLTAQILWAGPDLMVLVTGGDRPHIGAVAAATPRASLSDPRRISATASVLTYVGHKEDEAAKYLAETLASRLNTQVVAACGMHWDHIDQAGIEHARLNLVALAELLDGALRNQQPPEGAKPVAH